MDQLNIFDCLYDNFKLNKKVRLITLFSGYGSQELALDYLGVKYEKYLCCEWAVKSIQAYKDIHYPDNNIDYSMCLEDWQVYDVLHTFGISMDYNHPMSLEQITKKGEKWARQVYNNICATKNLVNICNVKGKDLLITEQDKYQYIMTYSFPCQDLSLAGKRAGMSDTSTRSGLLWEVERILTELHQEHKMIDCLVMENVPQVHSEKDYLNFEKWQLRLEELGYESYWKDINSKDMGIPQNRVRTFMVSVPKGHNYTMPKERKLSIYLNNILDANVDEKYFLSEKTINQIKHWKSYQNPLDSVLGKNSVCPTITTRIAESQNGGINASMKVLSVQLDSTTDVRHACTLETMDKQVKAKPSFDEVYSKIKSSTFSQNAGKIQEKSVCDTLCARDWKDPKCVIVLDNVLEETDITKHLANTFEKNDIDDCQEYDVIDGYNKTIIKDKVYPTLSTKSPAVDDKYIFIKNATKKGYLKAEEGDGIDISGRMEHHRGTVQKGISQTITTQGGEDVGVIVKNEKQIKE